MTNGDPIDWEAIHAKLPVERTKEAKHQRFELFKRFDPNGNNYLSLAEVDKGCRDVLQLYDVFDAKPVIMRAFSAAKSANDDNISKKNPHGADYIEKCEFRLLLVYMRQYFECWQMFSKLDDSGDGRIDFEEFKKALPLLKHWGAKNLPEPEEAFKQVDKNGGGVILFDEFAEWAMTLGLDLSDDDDFDDPALHDKPVAQK